MSCIIGAVFGNSVYIGGDSAGVDDEDNIVISANPKVFRNGPFLFGGAYSFRSIQVLRYVFRPPECDPERDAFEYMVADFIPVLRKCLKDEGLNKDENGADTAEAVFLVGFRGRLFVVYSDYQVFEPMDKVESIGSGAAYAKGAFAALEGLLPEERIKRALEVAERYCVSVRRPFIVERLSKQSEGMDETEKEPRNPEIGGFKDIHPPEFKSYGLLSEIYVRGTE